MMQRCCLIVLLALSIAGPPQASAAEFDCIIEPSKVLEIRSPLDGLVETVTVDRGDIVAKGQVLAELDSSVDRAQAAISKHRSEMEGAVRSGESRVEFTTKKSARDESLHPEGFVSTEALEQAVTERRLAQAELRDARDNRKLAELDYARQMEIIRLKTIRSPIDGVVTERILNQGEFAEAGVGRKPIFKLAEIGKLYVEVLLPAEAYGKVTRGMVVEVVPEIPAATRYRATLKVIDRVLDAASGTFGVRLELPNPRNQIFAGIRCKANFPEIEAKAGQKIRPAVAPQIQRPPASKAREQ